MREHLKRLALAGMVCALATRPSAAESFEAAGLAYLKMGGGVRAAGLGGAYSAVSDDVFALRWNPGGTAWLEGRSLGLAHNQWYQDIRQEEAVYADGLGPLRFGVLVASQSVPGIEFRLDRPTDDPIDRFSAQDLAAGLFLSRALSSRLAAGVGLKWLYEKIYTDQAQGRSWDLGMIYRLRPDLRLSAAVLDRGGNIRLNDRDLPLPSRLVLGVAYGRHLRSSRFPLLLALDYSRPSREPEQWRGGLEVPLGGAIVLRGGYIWGDGLSLSWSAGLGFRIGPIRFDYAYQPVRYDLGRIHRIGLIWEG